MTQNSNEQKQKQETATQRVIQMLHNLEQLIDTLNLIVKYQTFDLEATRRENQQLRKKLEEHEERNNPK